MAKISPAQKEKALQVASVIASGLAINGTLPDQKALRQCCVTGLKLVTVMEDVIASCEENDELLGLSLNDGQLYLKIAEQMDCRAKRKATEAADAKAAEEKAAADAAEAEAAKGKK